MGKLNRTFYLGLVWVCGVAFAIPEVFLAIFRGKVVPVRDLKCFCRDPSRVKLKLKGFPLSWFGNGPFVLCALANHVCYRSQRLEVTEYASTKPGVKTAHFHVLWGNNMLSVAHVNFVSDAPSTCLSSWKRAPEPGLFYTNANDKSIAFSGPCCRPHHKRCRRHAHVTPISRKPARNVEHQAALRAMAQKMVPMQSQAWPGAEHRNVSASGEMVGARMRLWKHSCSGEKCVEQWFVSPFVPFVWWVGDPLKMVDSPKMCFCQGHQLQRDHSAHWLNLGQAERRFPLTVAGSTCFFPSDRGSTMYA